MDQNDENHRQPDHPPTDTSCIDRPCKQHSPLSTFADVPVNIPADKQCSTNLDTCKPCLFPSVAAGKSTHHPSPANIYDTFSQQLLDDEPSKSIYALVVFIPPRWLLRSPPSTSSLKLDDRIFRSALSLHPAHGPCKTPNAARIRRAP